MGLMSEFISEEPISRLAAAKISIFACLALFWIVLHIFIIILDIISGQKNTMEKHLEITEKTVEHVFKK